MRIITDFRDYYDASQALGHDPTVVYMRKEKDIVLPIDFPFPSLDYMRYGWAYKEWDRVISADPYIIGFCGKIYAALRMVGRGKNYHKDYRDDSDVEYCYTMEAVEAFIESHCKKRDIEKFKEKRSHSKITIQDKFKKFFDDVEEKREAFGNIFADNNIPIFVAEEERRSWQAPKTVILKANVALKEYEFYKKFDVYTAFQEIEMYLGSMAVPAKEMPIITDVLKADSKGFNKYSFRKDPSKKKKRKKK